MTLKSKKVYFIKAVDAIDRNCEEGELAWEELTNHHCIPFAKDGIYQLERFWMGYSNDPYENFELAKKDWGNDWEKQGLLGKVIADYILRLDPGFTEWDKVYLDVRW